MSQPTIEVVKEKEKKTEVKEKKSKKLTRRSGINEEVMKRETVGDGKNLAAPSTNSFNNDSTPSVTETSAASASEDDYSEKSKKKKHKSREMSRRTTSKSKDEKLSPLPQAPASPSVPVVLERTEEDELELVTLSDKLSKLGNTRAEVAPEVYSSFHSLVTLAQRMNTRLDVPEIVIVGPRASGKSSTLEAIVGLPVSTVGGGGTRRPIMYKIINNPQQEQPLITIKRDALKSKQESGAEFSKDKIYTIQNVIQVGKEIEKRMSKWSHTPIEVHIESKLQWDLIIWDTPGLMFEDKDSKSKDRVEQIAVSLLTPERLILCVEDTKPWDEVNMIDWINRFDPNHLRTIFIYTKLYANILSKFPSHSHSLQLIRYLSNTPQPPTTTFYASFLTPFLRNQITSSSDYSQKLLLAEQRDFNLLDQVQFPYHLNKLVNNFIGGSKFVRFFLRRTLTTFSQNVPQLEQFLGRVKSENLRKRKLLERKLNLTNSHYLRVSTVRNVMEYLLVISSLITGSGKGFPFINGQTSEEEQFDSQLFWKNYASDELKVEDEAKNNGKIKYYALKIYGGQQFERLLSEFKYLVNNSLGSLSITKDEILNIGVGIKRAKNNTNYQGDIEQKVINVASEYVTGHAVREISPLIETLIERAMYVMNKMSSIADVIVRKQMGAGHGLNNGFEEEREDLGISEDGGVQLDYSPYFQSTLKDCFRKFVEERGRITHSKCVDELRCLRMVLIGDKVMRIGGRALEDERELEKEVKRVIDRLWEEMKERVAANITLKCHHFFLVPIELQMSGVVQAYFSNLSDEEIEEMFEVKVIRENLEREKKWLEVVSTEHEKKEREFEEAAGRFSILF